MRPFIVIAALVVSAAGTAAAQVTPADRDRAKIQNRLGWENMRAEAFEQAVKSFQNAIEIDPEFDVAFYGLGRAHMALKEYPSAISALVRCRDLHRVQSGRTFANVQEAQRWRNDRITLIDEQIRQVQTMPQTMKTQDMMRQLQNQRREVVESLQRGNNVALQSSVPAYVSLSLGSAYFRAGQLAEAEREYKETLAADNRSGEAHNNLAVVYLMTGRYADAERSLAAAKKIGFRVNPQLERDIKEKRKGS